MDSASVVNHNEAHRLKDTCDMCELNRLYVLFLGIWSNELCLPRNLTGSASKVRCNKTKPVCNRCQRLGYPCFYSPARRIRKRKYSSEETVDNDSGDADARQTTQTASIRDQNYEAHDRLAGSFQGNESFGCPNFEAFPSSNLNKPSANIPDSRVRADSEQEDDFSMIDLGMNNAVDGSTNCPSNLASLITTSGLPPTLHKHGSSDSSMDSTLSEGESDQASTHDDDFDCATVALSILQRLNTSATKLISPPSSSYSVETVSSLSSPTSNNADIQFQRVSGAIKRASTILICPCSRRADIGLLVATICIALLDALEVMLHGAIRTHTDQSSRPKRPTFKRSSMSNIMCDLATALEFRTPNPRDSTDVTAITMHILEQLPQVANLVTQFMRRYEQDMQRVGSDLLRALGASVMSRLRDMIDKVTDRVAQIS